VATIVGAAKVSGKTPGGLSVGFLEAMTQEERATIVDAGGTRSEVVVEPLTNYSVLRLRQDVLDNSNIGLIATSVNRRGGWPAVTGGVDWTLRFLESTYRVDGFFAGSRTTTAQSERVNGTAGRLSFNKDGGEHWRGSLSGDFTSKTYNINDVGFFRRPNDYGAVAQVLYRDDRVTDWKRFWSVGTRYHYRKNFDGAELFHQLSAEASVTFPNYWELNFEAEVDQGKYDDRETRGYGLYRKPERRRVELRFETDPRLLLVAEGNLTLGTLVGDGSFSEYQLRLELRPLSNLTLQFRLSHSRRDAEFAWVANSTTPLLSNGTGFTIFADRTTREWDFTSRGSFVFTSDLTLQYYIQIFFAKGTFANYAVMTSPESFVPYSGYQREDLSELSFHSNLVLRWEFLPGSTAYLVWSQARNGDRGSFSTPLSDDLRNTFALPMENVLLLKISYWLSL
jgi:hypothetical protein